MKANEHWPASIESMKQFSRPIPGIADGVPIREWRDLKNYWAVEGHKEQERIDAFMNMPSRTGK
jgi:head-tail adaptor